MKSFVIIFICTFSAISCEEQISVEEVLQSETMILTYFDCLVDKGVCPPGGDELKAKIPDVLEHGCPDCTEEVKSNLWKVIVYLIKHKPDLWKELEAKYDPDTKYKKKYATILQEKLNNNN
ncbi:hypothetical protein MTP99_001268 [Tenebrio molitor]|nr:hypothetical protein MTP99_001268 [Tenebrio molitor]CAH1364944.1 unnamed protein product [Tenebrio molitor]